MRKMLLIICLIAGLATADGAVPLHSDYEPTGDILWENPYDFALLSDGLYSYYHNHATDDFVLDSQSQLEAVILYTAYEEAHPRDLELAVYEDDAGSPGPELWRITVSGDNITDIDTGDDAFSFDIWETRLELDPADYQELPTGTHWLEVYDPTDQLFGWFCEDGGNFQIYGHTVFDYSAFFIVEGTPNSPVHPASWGAIKALN